MKIASIGNPRGYSRIGGAVVVVVGTGPTVMLTLQKQEKDNFSEASFNWISFWPTSDLIKSGVQPGLKGLPLIGISRLQRHQSCTPSTLFPGLPYSLVHELLRNAAGSTLKAI
jgi:hypothetical protein